MKINEKNLCDFAVSATPVDKEGYLNKRGKVNKNFQRRYFVLKRNLLFYFDKKGDKEPVGVIILEGCTIAEDEEQFCFKIVFHGANSRSYILGAESQESMEQWMNALACAGYDYMKLRVAELQRQLDDIEESPLPIAQAVNSPVPPPRHRHNPFNKPETNNALHQRSQSLRANNNSVRLETTLCLGGCDPNGLETLDINMGSVRVSNRLNNQPNPPNPPNVLNNINNGNTVAVNAQNRRANNRPNNTAINLMPGPSGVGNSSRGTDEDIVCFCNVEAMQLTVKKDSPNKGRKFYNCKNDTCRFFLWASDDENVNQVQAVQNNDIRCDCDLPANRRTVKKDGANKGKLFYCCSKPQGQDCNFFKWVDEGDGDNGGGGGGGDDGDGGDGGGRRAMFQNTKWKGKTTKGKTNKATPYGNQTKAKRKCGKCEGHMKNKCPN